MGSKITILGAGAFGTSIATLLSENGYNVSIWCYESELVDFINNDHENKLYFPGFRLNNNITATNSLKEALSGSQFIFEAIPVKFLKKILLDAKEFINKDQIFVALSKGIEKDSLLFSTQIINNLLENKVVVLSGPNFAKEIAEKKHTVSVIATKDKQIGINLKNILENDYFKIEVTDDVVGVQVGAALKNLISLLVGIAHGHDSGQNSIAFFITKGLQEIAQLSKIFGGNQETIYGLSGFGDLILSATGSLGRNLKIGKEIGKLKSNNKFDHEKFFENKILPESINTIQSTYQIIKSRKLDLPLCMGVYKLVYEKLFWDDFLKEI